MESICHLMVVRNDKVFVLYLSGNSVIQVIKKLELIIDSELSFDGHCLKIFFFFYRKGVFSSDSRKYMCMRNLQSCKLHNLHNWITSPQFSLWWGYSIMLGSLPTWSLVSCKCCKIWGLLKVLKTSYQALVLQSRTFYST